MKKYLIALVLGLVLLLALATTVALADNGPHGGFAANTDACASCHRIHSAKSADGFLLVQSDIYELCTSCHDGSGAYTNVVDGTYASGSYAVGTASEGDANNPLFGGGFENNTMLHEGFNQNFYDTALVAVSEPVTSSHKVDGATAGPVWGAGNYGTNTPSSGVLTLECTSCHNPHGNAGHVGNVPTGAPMATYRLLDFTPVGSNGFEVTAAFATWWINASSKAGINVPDIGAMGAKWYTPNTDVALDESVAASYSAYRSSKQYPWQAYIQGKGDMSGRTYVYKRPAFLVDTAATLPGTVYSCPDPVTGEPTYPPTACAAPTGTLFDNTSVLDELSLFCAQCHDRHASNRARTQDTGDTTFMYQHSSASSSVPCVVCHNAHGTSSVMTTSLAQNATFATDAVTAENGSSLLKMDNRALCVDCHGNSVNAYLDQVVPVAPVP